MVDKKKLPASAKLIRNINWVLDDASPPRPCNGLWCTGYYLPDSNSFFCRIYYDGPAVIKLSTEPPNKHKRDCVTVDNKGHISFSFQLKGGFYALDKKQRLQEITRFVETARRIGLGINPPITALLEKLKQEHTK